MLFQAGHVPGLGTWMFSHHEVPFPESSQLPPSCLYNSGTRCFRKSPKFIPLFLPLHLPPAEDLCRKPQKSVQDTPWPSSQQAGDLCAPERQRAGIRDKDRRYRKREKGGGEDNNGKGGKGAKESGGLYVLREGRTNDCL